MGRVTKRIAFLINELGGGGAERVLVTLANHLHDRMGFDVAIATLEQGPSAYPLSPGIEVRPLWTHRVTHGPGKLLSLPLAALAFARFVRHHRSDAAISFLVRANLVMVMSCRFGNRLPPVISERAVSTPYSGSSPVAVVMRTLVRRLYPQAHAIVAISAGVKTSLERLGVPADRVRVIYNPQNLDEIRAIAATADRTAGDAFRVVTAARLTGQKDLPTLLRAFRAVHDEDARARLVILGEGPDAISLRQLARELGIDDAVEWRGWAPPYRVMAESDVFVLSSRYEGFANVIVEAMACGLPVVSTDCRSGPSEILAGGEHGILVPVGDSAALAAAILRLKADPRLRASLRERGSERARDFDVTLIAPSYLDVLDLGLNG